MSSPPHPPSVGATIDGAETRFRLWAPSARSVSLVLGDAPPIAMERDERGFAEVVVQAPPGTRYRYRIDDEIDVPDPASRFQPEGVHGPSELIDPAGYTWRTAWSGRPWHETVLYELHLGTFSEEGTYAGAIARLDHLAELGVTAIELMPLAAAPGDRNWGYDGVLLFAPNQSYGRPDELKRLIDEAHARGLMVFLDVVYNHFGPEGNYLHRYARPFFTKAIETPWGAAIDVDGPDGDVIRRFFIDNALYWLEEYRFDGLRLDAIHALPQEKAPTFVEQLADEVRRRVTHRRVHLVVENDDNRASLLERDEAGRPIRYDAQWNDDFHHAMHVIVTGESDGYYRDYPAPLAALGRCLAEGFAYQGEASPHRGGRPRGQPSGDLSPTAFVNFIQNHDQIGNRPLGDRLGELVTAPEALDAAVTILLLAPSVPLLFMGEEWNASTPFQFFCDFEESLNEAVRKGRREEFASFAGFADASPAIPDPCGRETMVASRLRWEERDEPAHRATLERYRHLLAVRRREIVPRLEQIRGGDHQIVEDRLSVRFEGAGFVLGLDFNPGPGPLTRLRSEGERVLATTSNVEAPHRLPAWGALWWLAEIR